MQQYRNAMEAVVLETYEMVKDSLNCCQCEICKTDVIAYALNHLPPKYVVSPQGELYTKASMLGSQYKITVISALAEAARVVRERPKHA